MCVIRLNAGNFRAVVLLGAVAASAVVPHAPQAQGQQAAARTVLVPVEFRALKAGLPILDLKPQEIAVRVDNVDREIVALDRIRAGASDALPVPFATNTVADRGRDVVLVVDEESFQTGGESRLRDALQEMVRQLAPRDRVGLVSLHASGPTAALTARPGAALQSAISQVRGRAIGPESVTELSCRTRRLLPVVSTLMKNVDAGVTATLLLFSAALAAPGATAAPAPGAESGCLILPNDFDEFRAAAASSGAGLYSIHLADSSTTDDRRSSAGLERLAGETGGQFFRVAGDPAPVMKQIATDLAGFYVATVPVELGAARNARRVTVTIRRDGVNARFKPALAVSAIEAKTVSPRDMMRASTSFRSLFLRASAVPSRDTAKTAKVVVLFEPLEPTVSISAAMAGLFDASGKLVSQWTAEPHDLANHPILAGLSVAPGTYRLRVAAVDSIGRSGSIDQEVRVELPAAGSLTTSGVVMGVTSATGFAPKLQFSSADAKAGVYLEAYGTSACTSVSATAEVALTEQGPALASSRGTSSAGDQPDACVLFAEFDLARLAPGDYAVRVNIQQNGQVAGRRMAAFRKSTR
jgi:hypothetical protein